MVIKINKKGKSIYKSSKLITTADEVRKADKLDLELDRKIKEIERILKKEKLIDSDKIKKDPLKTWYIIGKNINDFLSLHNDFSKEEKNIFWEYLYGRSNLINKKLPLKKISQNRNDFVLASKLAKYSFEMISTVGSWALWREVVGCDLFLKDIRILKWLIGELKIKSRTRDEARPLLKAVSRRLRKIDTIVLNDNELLEILKNLKSSI